MTKIFDVIRKPLLTEKGTKLREDDVVMLFLAGHGVTTHDGEPRYYFLPAEAALEASGGARMTRRYHGPCDARGGCCGREVPV